MTGPDDDDIEIVLRRNHSPVPELRHAGHRDRRPAEATILVGGAPPVQPLPCIREPKRNTARGVCVIPLEDGVRTSARKGVCHTGL